MLIGAGFYAAVSLPAGAVSPEYRRELQEAVRAFNAREFPAALAALDRADRLEAATPLTMNTRGAAFIELRKFEEGAEYCRKALALDPKFYPARFNLCEVEFMQKNYAQARALFQALGDEHPHDELVQFRILLTWLLEGNEEEARQALEAIRFPSKTPAYYYANAAWEFARGNAAEARKWMQRGNWVFPPAATGNFAESFREVGWIQEALPPSLTLPDAEPPMPFPPAKLELADPSAPQNPSPLLSR